MVWFQLRAQPHITLFLSSLWVLLNQNMSSDKSIFEAPSNFLKFNYQANGDLILNRTIVHRERGLAPNLFLSFETFLAHGKIMCTPSVGINFPKRTDSDFLGPFLVEKLS